MTSLLERRLFLGVAALALLALAGTATTVVSQRASAGNNETCATQEADDAEVHTEAEGSESETEDANDTDNVELECGD